MYTGIVKGIGTVIHMTKTAGLAKLTIAFPQDMLLDIETGASIAIDGCCLTVVERDENTVTFHLITETLEKTTLGVLSSGAKVNLERSLTFGDEIGGHVLSGHIFGTTEILSIETPENNHIIRCKLPTDMKKYFFNKGFIALHGASLTLNNVKDNSFEVHLIPETLSRTTFAAKQVGDMLNIEIDSQTQTLVETAERIAAR